MWRSGAGFPDVNVTSFGLSVWVLFVEYNRKVVTFYLVFHLNFESIFISFISFLWDKMDHLPDCESYLIFSILMRDLLGFPIRKNVFLIHFFICCFRTIFLSKHKQDKSTAVMCSSLQINASSSQNKTKVKHFQGIRKRTQKEKGKHHSSN